MLSIIQLTKTFGSRTLFDNINFQINPGEKIGLIGRNGNGKTTLFKIITGEEDFDYGKINKSKNYKIGYVSQHLNFIKDTVREEGSLGLPKNNQHDLWLLEKYLFGLGFDNDMLNLHPKKLSGGFQIRLNLVKALLENPDLLLLDEPTNYLDITSIRWLIQFLKTWKGDLFLITHDRSFMDEIVTHTMIIHRNKIKKITGKTDKLYEQIAQEEEVYERQRINDEKKEKNVKIFISRFRAKARLAGMVQSRIKELEKKEKKDKLNKIKLLDFQFKYHEFKAQILLQINNLKYSYDQEIELLKGVSFNIHKNDRIAVVGPNGKGKSTLLKILTEKLHLQSGEIKKHNNLKIGYYAQTNDIDLHDEHTVEEEIALENTDNDGQTIRGICGAMLFEQDDALKKIKILSGGEKSRVLLGKILVNPVNLLILDEPTNHLDMEACDALLSAIDNFDGAVLFVTHNELFLNMLANRLIVFDNNQVKVFEGTYHEFVSKIGWNTEKESQQNNKKSNTIINKKELRKKRVIILEEKSKIVKPLENKYHKLEKTIKQHEDELSHCEQEIIEASKEKNGTRIESLSKKCHELEKEISKHYKELEIIMEQFENASKIIEAKLADLEL
jgi:ATP-binding cassette, subfamily F, member 3